MGNSLSIDNQSHQEMAKELLWFVNDRLVQYYLDRGYTIPQIKAVAVATQRHFPSLGV